MPRKLILAVPLMLASALLCGCGADTFSEAKLFPSKPKIFSMPEWGNATKVSTADLNNTGPAPPEEYIDASGRCASATVAAAPAEPAVGTVAGDLASASAPAADTAQPLLPGGVALGMTECQVAQHAGQPGQVDIGADENADRKVVLTYQTGPWPGIYTFKSGRLSVIDRVAAPEPVKPVKKKPALKKKPVPAAG